MLRMTGMRDLPHMTGLVYDVGVERVGSRKNRQNRENRGSEHWGPPGSNKTGKTSVLFLTGRLVLTLGVE